MIALNSFGQLQATTGGFDWEDALRLVGQAGQGERAGTRPPQGKKNNNHNNSNENNNKKHNKTNNNEKQTTASNMSRCDNQSSPRSVMFARQW